MDLTQPENSWCLCVCLSVLVPMDLLKTTSRGQGPRTKTSRSRLQVKIPLMELTVAMQEEGCVYCGESPGAKTHKYTHVCTHRITISGRPPQDIIVAWGSCHAHLCCLTRPVCVFTTSYAHVSVSLSVYVIWRIMSTPPQQGSAFLSLCLLNGFPREEKKIARNNIWTGIETCFPIAYTYLITLDVSSAPSVGRKWGYFRTNITWFLFPLDSFCYFVYLIGRS